MVRTRLAAARVFADEVSYRGFGDCFWSTWRQGGVRGLYAGCFASMLEIAPYSAIVFTAYEGIKQRLLPVGSTGVLPSGPQILAGVTSGLTAASICYPMDTVRRQLMLDGALGFDARYGGSLWKCCNHLWRQGGFPLFYRGWTATLLKAVPTVTITFLTKDFLSEMLKRS
ncbi:mcfB [Symbiodinium pilosum]|uniref:McfB protein n=1 Tax=Symbiodinium pilosum TaxID=2952 RepID=A0A812YHH1_SYMPI|nr:mcfB [Symbiodinium pilosum]